MLHKYSYEEVRDLWDFTSKKRIKFDNTKNNYIMHIIKKFDLVKSKHIAYLGTYYDRYIKEKGRDNG